MSKRVGGVSPQTADAYALYLTRLHQETGGQIDTLTVQRFFARMRERSLKPSSIHKAYSVLRTFFRWCVNVEAMPSNPLRGFSVRLPKTLPDVPTEEEIRAVLAVTGNGILGLRNRCLILVMCDAGLRASETLHLLVEDWRPTDRSLFIRAGKGSKDRVAFVTPTTARALKEYLSKRRVTPEDFLFPCDDGRPLQRRHLVQVLHRLSARAGLPVNRRLHPHALRHAAATSWLRNGMGLDEVRRLLGHESLNTTLRYSSLVSADLQAAHKKAAAIERMRI